MSDIVGKIPDFDPDGTLGAGPEEVKESAAEEVAQETDTPAELPAEGEAQAEPEKPADTGEDTEQPDPDFDTRLNKALAKATEGLRNEITGLKNQLRNLSGTDRKLAQDQIIVAQQNLDELKDINPSDVALIEKVLKSKGYMTKEEAQNVSYETTQRQILNQFLDKFPEYKPENDPDNANWNRLINEYGVYARPKDPLQIANLLEKAHKATTPVVSGRNLTPARQAVKTASLGAGGKGRPSSGSKSLTPEQRRIYEEGGWSEEDINEIEKSL